MAVVLGGLAFAPAQAAGAETVGEAFEPTNLLCGGANTFIQSGSVGDQYQVSAAGVITSWSFHASETPPSVKLKLARPVEGNSFEIHGESDAETPSPSVLNTFDDVRIPVEAGDVIGVHFGPSAFFPCGRGLVGGYVIHFLSGDIPVGATTEFNAASNSQLNVSAQVEPDVDADGFGDETQDGCPTDASAQGPCPPPAGPGPPAGPDPPAADTDPPVVTITKVAPGVVKKRNVKFRFEANEPGSTFECALKGKAARRKLRPFKPCTSPKRYKRLRPGKHTFKVRATAPAPLCLRAEVSDEGSGCDMHVTTPLLVLHR